jgi:beta-mannanase
VLAVCQIDRAKRPDLFRRCLFVLRPKLEGPATDAWAGKVNAIVKRVDALDRNVKTEMGERFGGADQKLIEMAETFSNVDQKMSVMDQKMSVMDQKLNEVKTEIADKFSNVDQKMSEIDEKMSALETKMDANVEKILGAIGLLGHSV